MMKGGPNFGFLAVTVVDLDRVGVRLQCAVLPSQLPVDENKSDSNKYKYLKVKNNLQVRFLGV